MKYIFDIWKKINSDIKEAEHILLVLDYDGTLTPIVDNPELAMLNENTRDKIKDLTNHPFFTIGIISERSLTDIKKKVAINKIYYGGNYGLEIESPEIKFTSPDAKELMPLMVLIKDDLEKELGDIKGVLVENKGLALSVHFRQVKRRNIVKVKDIFDSILAPILDEDRVKVTRGKKVLEVRPPLKLDKGKAFSWMIKNLSLNFSRVLPIYIGDDHTDESAFEVANKNSGLSIFVGKRGRHLCANYYLKSPEDVRIFLEQIKKIVEPQ
ncbi:MAG: trehalose-phosphatase [Candidatus Omnitrophica bacterium]|nr:trehalose-phosphatase [Candidatus Omnitrophota bacterium]